MKNTRAANLKGVALSCSKPGSSVLVKITFMESVKIAALHLWFLPNFFLILQTEAATLGLSVGGSKVGKAIRWKKQIADLAANTVLRDLLLIASREK